MDSEWYYVKNWWKFQDYRYRRPPWIRLWKDIENDPAFASLSEINQYRLIRLWLFAAEIDGRLPRDHRKIGRRLGVYHHKKCDDLVSIFTSKGFISQQDIRGMRLVKSSTETETETETDIHTPPVVQTFPSESKPFRKPFEKPTLHQVVLYMEEIEIPNAHLEAEGFMAYYESNGWRVGKNPMKVWKGSVQTWKHNLGRFGGNGNGKLSAKAEPWQPPDPSACSETADFIRSIGPAATPDQQRWLKKWDSDHKV